MTHFVYPYVIPESPIFGWELKYSIRSLYKYYQEPFDITIIGEIPSWIDSTEIRCISYDNSKKFRLAQNRTNDKFLKIAEESSYKDFVWMNDDMYLLRPVDSEVLKIGYYLDWDILEYKDEFSDLGKSGELSVFQRSVKHTYFALKNAGKRAEYNFAVHIPRYYESIKIQELNKKIPLIAKDSDKKLQTILFENLYMNYYDIEPVPVKNYRLGFWDSKDDSDPVLQEGTILNHNDAGFMAHPWILEFLQAQFPKRCKGESWRP